MQPKKGNILNKRKKWFCEDSDTFERVIKNSYCLLENWINASDIVPNEINRSQIGWVKTCRIKPQVIKTAICVKHYIHVFHIYLLKSQKLFQARSITNIICVHNYCKLLTKLLKFHPRINFTFYFIPGQVLPRDERYVPTPSRTFCLFFYVNEYRNNFPIVF